jgi:hypothetical protein
MLYRDWLARACRLNGVDAWFYCLIPNQAHVILAPSDESGLSRAVGDIAGTSMHACGLPAICFKGGSNGW